MLGVRRSPFSGFSRSSLVESRHGLQWLAIKCTGFATRVIRQLFSIAITPCLNAPWPRRARIRACIDRWGGSKTEIGGFLDSLAGTTLEAVPLFAGWAITEGPIEAAEFARMRAWIGEQLTAAGELDALLLALHGAMCA